MSPEGWTNVLAAWMDASGLSEAGWEPVCPLAVPVPSPCPCCSVGLGGPASCPAQLDLRGAASAGCPVAAALAPVLCLLSSSCQGWPNAACLLPCLIELQHVWSHPGGGWGVAGSTLCAPTSQQPDGPALLPPVGVAQAAPANTRVPKAAAGLQVVRPGFHGPCWQRGNLWPAS